MIILRESGNVLFSYTFGGQQVNENLIGSFLIAINSFSKEAFSIGGNIERITNQEYILSLHQENKLTICYVYKNDTYFALAKLHEFIFKLKENTELFAALIGKNISYSRKLETDLEELVKDTFIEPQDET